MYGSNPIKYNYNYHSNGQEIRENNLSGASFLTSYLSKSTFWYGPLPGHSVNAIQAELTYNKLGWARIVWLPRTQKQKDFLKTQSNKADQRWVKQYVLSGKNRNEFDIWALYAPAKYDGDEPDLENSVFIPKIFPVTAELFKLVNEKWISVKRITIPNSHNLFEPLPSR